MAFGDAPKEIADFNHWLGKQPHRIKLVIAGNHDLMFERHPGAARELLDNASRARFRSAAYFSRNDT
jgi:hypothetical protein